MIDGIVISILKALVIASFYWKISKDWQGIIKDLTEIVRKIRILRKGDENMLSKEMKKVKFNKVADYLADGEQVFMLLDDGSLVELTTDTDAEEILQHIIRKGSFAVHRKQVTTFKSIRIGNWTFIINRQRKEEEYE